MKINPKLKYLAGLQARNEHRTVSSLVENALETYLQSSGITTNSKKESLLALSDDLWSTEPGERFIALAETFPHLLTFEEEHLWALLNERELITPDRGVELEASFRDLQNEAIERANCEPVVSVNGFPFRGGRMDTSIPKSIVQRAIVKSRKGGKA
jgi:hypothetical protein